MVNPNNGNGMLQFEIFDNFGEILVLSSAHVFHLESVKCVVVHAWYSTLSSRNFSLLFAYISSVAIANKSSIIPHTSVVSLQFLEIVL